MRRRLAALIVAGLLALLAAPTAAALSPFPDYECEIVLGFASLKALVDDAEGPNKVGICVENEQFHPDTGRSLQKTIGGLLIWRKADNWTAFTDGNRTGSKDPSVCNPVSSPTSSIGSASPATTKRREFRIHHRQPGRLADLRHHFRAAHVEPGHCQRRLVFGWFWDISSRV